MSATAEYGAVNASCENDGLFTGYDEFGWRQHSTNGLLELAQTAPRSVRASWYGADLVNYESPAAPELLRASVEEVSVDRGAAERQRKVVTRFSPPTDELDILVADLNAQRGVAQDDGSVRLELVARVLHQYAQARLLHGHEDREDQERHPFHAARVDGRTSGSRAPLRWRLGDQTDFRAYVLSGGRLVELLDEEPLSVRTFEGSRRYRRLIAVTVENGVHLISAIDTF